MALTTAALAASCATPGPRDAAPVLATPSALGATTTAADARYPWPAARWWEAYGDAALNRLVAQALAGHPSLAVAQARVRQAQAAAGIAQAARAPQVNASVDLTDQQFTRNGMIPPPLADHIYWNNSAQIGLGWDADLFGRQRAALAAAVGQQRVVQAEAQAARMMLAAQVVQGWVQLARLVDARAIAAQAVSERERQATLVNQRIRAGLDTQAEARQADAGVAQARAELEALDDAAARARRALAELSGGAPDALADATPHLPPLLARAAARDVPAALPADLLGRRADLTAQRWRVEAAAREVDVARAQFYPNVNLMAFVGLSSLGFSKFVDAGSFTAGFGPALRLPLFDGGRLKANLSARQAEVDAAVQGYRGTLLRALHEVADELGTRQSLQRQQRAQADALAAAQAGYDLAVQRYRAELGSHLQVLAAHQGVLAAQRALVDVQARRLASDAALVLALGGGYDEAAAEAGAEGYAVTPSHPGPAARP